MENKNIFAVKVILIIFFLVVLILGVGGYYFYYKNIKSLDNITKIKTDHEFNNLIENNKKNDKDSTEAFGDGENEDVITKNNCYVDGVMVKHGEKIKMYTLKLVSPFDNCDRYAKERLCDNGFLLGDENFRYPHCKQDVDCELPDGTIVKNNETIHLYSRTSVPFNKRGETCEKYAFDRICRNNVLSGPKEFVYRDCRKDYSNSCTLADGSVKANNEVFTAYKKNKVAWNESCNTQENMKRFTCSAGQLIGGDLTQFPYLDCIRETPKDCYLSLNTPEGQREQTHFKHGEKNIKLFSRGYRTQNHSCGWFSYDFDCINGEMKPSDNGDYSVNEYNYVRCYEN